MLRGPLYNAVALQGVGMGWTAGPGSLPAFQDPLTAVNREVKEPEGILPAAPSAKRSPKSAMLGKLGKGERQRTGHQK